MKSFYLCEVLRLFPEADNANLGMEFPRSVIRWRPISNHKRVICCAVVCTSNTSVG